MTDEELNARLDRLEASLLQTMLDIHLARPDRTTAQNIREKIKDLLRPSDGFAVTQENSRPRNANDPPGEGPVPLTSRPPRPLTRQAETMAASASEAGGTGSGLTYLVERRIYLSRRLRQSRPVRHAAQGRGRLPPGFRPRTGTSAPDVA